MSWLIIKIKSGSWSINTSEGIEISKNLNEEVAFGAMKSYLENNSNILGGVVLDKEYQELTKKLSERFNIPFIYDNGFETIPYQLEKEKQNIMWSISYDGCPGGKKEYSYESLLTIGNGYLGLRGTTPEMSITTDTYPATYVAGVYNELTSEVSGHLVRNEDFVNLPNMQIIKIKVDGIELEAKMASNFTRKVMFKTGEFISEATYLIEGRGALKVKISKIVSMKNRHFYGIKCDVELDFDGKLEFISEVEGDVYNYNVERYRQLENKHLVSKFNDATGVEATYIAKTINSNMTIFQKSKLNSSTLNLSDLKSTVFETGSRQTIELNAEKDKVYSIEKMVYIEVQNTDLEPKEITFEPFSVVYKDSAKQWDELWEQSGIEVTGDMMSQKLLNLHTYHMLVSASPVGNKQLDASITARGLHGEAYRGHIFWDELFILPFYILNFPETAKELLMYRYNRLEAAKELAKASGFKGAMYPWQSGLSGGEESQDMHINPLSGEWKKDNSHRQRHVSLAVAYNVWMYYHLTNDQSFFKVEGAEMLSEIARFWIDIAEFNENTQKYDISGVMGPDEFHEMQDGLVEGGLKNNAYTNLMVAWLFSEMSKLKTEGYQFGLTKDEWQELNNIKNSLKIPLHDEAIISQFEGYELLKEVDFDEYKKKYNNIYRMDRILNAEGKSADEYKVAKQADSLMIFYNLPEETVTGLLDNLGYSMPNDYVEKNLEYYLARTSHGSTLSRVVHAKLGDITDDFDMSYGLYKEALYSDYHDIQGGTTAEGIHTGVMSSTLYLTLTLFAGLDIRGEMIALSPRLPKEWRNLSFKIIVRGTKYQFTITSKEVLVITDKDSRIIVDKEIVQLRKGYEEAISL